jgi:hypothetical protein
MIGRLRIRDRLVALYETLALIRRRKRRALEWRVRGIVRRPKEVVLVDPLAITRIARLRPNGQIDHVERPRDVVSGKRLAGMILDEGDFHAGPRFDDNWAVRACHERWVQGLDWRDTGYRTGYEVYVRKNLVRDWDEFALTRLERWDALFLDLSRGDYRLNRDPLDEVQVAVSGDGGMLFCDGKHRLIAARILGYESIPVIVNFWSRAFLDRIGTGLTPREMAGAIKGGREPRDGQVRGYRPPSD